MTLTELAEQLAVAKSSAFALLQTLVARGFAAESGARLEPPLPARHGAGQAR